MTHEHACYSHNAATEGMRMSVHCLSFARHIALPPWRAARSILYYSLDDS
jgi:hypothetical protein